MCDTYPSPKPLKKSPDPIQNPSSSGG